MHRLRRVRRALALAVVPVVALTTGACFATRSDVRVLQGDIAVLRAEAARADSMHREQLRQVSRQVGVVNDSLRTVATVLSRFQGDVSLALHNIGQQLITLTELAGASQKKLQEMRADLEARSADAAAAQQAAAPIVPSSGTPSSGTPSSGTPSAGGVKPLAPTPGQSGPNQLFQASQAQLRRGAAMSARAGFEDFLAAYPKDDLAADAQFGIAETYAAEGKGAAADSAYALVVARYPKSDRAPTALYKRAAALRDARQTPKARAMFQQIIDKYPRSDEADLARDILKTLK
jgi:tol-pal system protein YbgF